MFWSRTNNQALTLHRGNVSWRSYFRRIWSLCKDGSQITPNRGTIGPAPRDRAQGRSGEVGVMVWHDPRAIANEFIRLNGGPMNQMKLQKLVYMAHGWNLAINREPLAAGRIEAWDGGPVMRIIWDHIMDFGYNAVGCQMGASKDAPFRANLSSRERDVIEHVWRKYGRFSGLELSNMTHKPGTPWSNAYFGKGRNAALSQSDIQQHFVELALAGRAETA